MKVHVVESGDTTHGHDVFGVYPTIKAAEAAVAKAFLEQSQCYGGSCDFYRDRFNRRWFRGRSGGFANITTFELGG